MNKEIFNKISSYLSSHDKLTLATVNENGKPIAHTVEYVSDGNTVYFASHADKRKIQNIMKMDDIAYTVDQDYDDWNTIEGIQMIGKAEILQTEQEIGAVMGLFMQKFPQLTNMPQDFAAQLRIVKINPIEGRYLNNNISYGHFDQINYN